MSAVHMGAGAWRRPLIPLLAAACTVAAILLLAPGGVAKGHASGPDGGDVGRHGLDEIQHIVVIIKENRSFDNLFGRFPGAVGATTARLENGQVVPLAHAPDHTMLDIDHSRGAALHAVDGGRMDGFRDLLGAIQNGNDESLSQYWPGDLPVYWGYAHDFTLDDQFFSTILGPSFPNHLVTVASTSNGTIDNPIDIAPGEPSWGCDSGPNALVAQLNPATGTRRFVRPCFNLETLPATPDRWRYLEILLPAAVPVGLRVERPGRHQLHPILTAVEVECRRQFRVRHRCSKRKPAFGELAGAGGLTSDHPPMSMCVGEQWSQKMINAVVTGPDWPSTVIVVVWDDFGGFYDHVVPPVVTNVGYGPRVPGHRHLSVLPGGHRRSHPVRLQFDTPVHRGSVLRPGAHPG